MKKILLLFAVAAALVSCMPNNGSNKKEADNKARFQRFYDEVINAHNPNAVDSFCTADFTDHQPSPGHSGKGLDDLKGQFRDFFAAFPDIHMKPEMMVADGDTVMALVTMTGTNSGAMGPNMPATNKQINVQAMDVIVIKDGKASERWGFGEEMKMMQQMGMMPQQGAAPMDSSKMMSGEKKM
jgi:predicted ester cyclase